MGGLGSGRQEPVSRALMVHAPSQAARHHMAAHGRENVAGGGEAVSGAQEAFWCGAFSGFMLGASCALAVWDMFL